MTTGRINQVTILVRGGQPGTRPGARRARPQRGQSMYAGREDTAGAGLRCLGRGARLHALQGSCPDFPTEFPKRRSTTHAASGRWAPGRGAVCAAQEEGAHQPVTRTGRGYRRRLPPKCLWGSGGHRPGPLRPQQSHQQDWWAAGCPSARRSVRRQRANRPGPHLCGRP